ncbi:MAG: hypothetical protein H5T44_03185 [Thermoplasmatales archaeon]|nr:hypothetical protein [Thermoplasmatales archaeon]
MKVKKKEEERKYTREDAEIRGWILKIEQNVEALDKRIDAIERRLSGENVNFYEKKEAKEIKRAKPIVFLEEENEKFKEMEKKLAEIENKISTKRLERIILPIEITSFGVGLLLIIVAIMVFLGYQNIVSSPPFIAIIGGIFIILTFGRKVIK